jgi:DNA processing protein
MFQIIEEASKENYAVSIRVVKINDEEYPEQLRKIKNPPEQLYVRGNVENLKQIGIAVIGTRHCSNYGRKVCKLFTNNLVGYDLNIISGLAIGIDSCAHKSCLEAKGKTIAVLPSGFNNVFPKQNEGLLQEIIEKGGTVVTEYPPEFEKTQESCRQRNRIMSGLAIGTLVIEAEKRSGTTITVRNTNEQGKKAYCIPSSIYNSKGIGTNMMIKEGSAKMVTEIEDIIKDFPELNLKRREDFEFRDLKSPAKTKKEKAKKQSIKIDEENLEVYNLLKTEPKDINEIARILNKPVSEITYKVMLLEIEGTIKQLEDKRYEINNEKEEE